MLKNQCVLQIQNSISTLQQELNESRSLIEDAQTYLSEHVINFNGSVRITPAIPSMYPSFPVVCPSGGGVSVIVDWQCIKAMATSYRRRALQANESGYGNYSNIQKSYSMVSDVGFVKSCTIWKRKESRARLKCDVRDKIEV